MITFLCAVSLLFWSVRFCDLPAWGWWLAMLLLALFADVLLHGATRRAPRPPSYGPALVMEAEQRMANLRESSRRVMEESDRVAEEVRADRMKHADSANAAYAEWRRKHNRKGY